MHDEKPTVLLIDNDEGMVEALRSRLENEGYRCLSARSGSQGLAVFHEQHVDLVITDLNMPMGDGIEVARAVRAVSEVPIIVATGFRDEYRDDLRVIRDVTILRKPFRSTDLLELIEATVVF